MKLKTKLIFRMILKQNHLIMNLYFSNKRFYAWKGLVWAFEHLLSVCLFQSKNLKLACDLAISKDLKGLGENIS